MITLIDLVFRETSTVHMCWAQQQNPATSSHIHFSTNKIPRYSSAKNVQHYFEQTNANNWSQRQFVVSASAPFLDSIEFLKRCALYFDNTR
mmetsp:Transcript_23270/g.35868  ORF Transcript_23270/g.35868 Transcript_23270/m.35868 type:complete len:91 (+) Transcript_23270:80-352(+)